MGRKDAVQFTLEWAARARAYGATVTFQAGWDGRGNGTSADYEGAIVHHTASASSAARPNPTLSVLMNGRSDLSGPLCNVTGPWCTEDSPRLHVVAAHPANHAGASGGRSMGPLPVTSLFNKRVFGLEIDYAGSTAMTAGQRRAALIFARSVTDVLNRSIEYVRAHAETSITGKWDPGYASGKTIDMGAFRRDATTLAVGGDDMPLTDADVDLIWRKAQATAGFGGWVAPITFLEHTRIIVAQAVDAGNAAAAAANTAATAADTARKAADDARIAAASKASAPSAVAGPVTIDYAQLAAALAPMLADEWDRRARDSDPKTGPAT